MPTGNKQTRRPRNSGPSSSSASRLQKEVYRLELVRLRQEALALSVTLNTTETMTEAQKRTTQEELDLVLNRAKLFVHLLEDETSQLDLDEIKEAKASEADYDSDSIETPSFPKSTSSDELGEDIPTDLLSVRLTNLLKKKLRPTLVSQLSNDDPPISPPQIITMPFEEVIHEYMRSLPPPKNASILECGRALVALQRGLAIRIIAETAAGDADARQLALQATASLASASSFELLLFRAKMHSGSVCMVHYGAESVVLHVGGEQTFRQLLEHAARYWHLEPDEFTISDQHGAIWLSRAQVLESLRLSPIGRQLHLLRCRLGNESSMEVREEESVVRDDEEVKELPPQAEALVAAEELIDFQVVDDDATRFVDPKPRTRSAMVYALIRLLILSAIIYVDVASRNDIQNQYETCQSLNKEIVSKTFPDGPTTFYSINDQFDLFPFFLQVLPYALWPIHLEDVVDEVSQTTSVVDATPEDIENASLIASLEDHLPRVGRHNYLLGGVRLRQQRVKPANYPQCVDRPFMPKDRQAERGTFTEFENIRYALVMDVIANIGWERFLELFPLDGLINLLFFTTASDIVDILTPYRNTSIPLGMGSLESSTALRRGSSAADNSLEANITAAATLINRSKSSSGDVWLCYPSYSSTSHSDEDYGPLLPSNFQGGLELLQTTILSLLASLPSEGPFFPPATEASEPLPGLLPAWQYRNPAQIGDFYEFRITSYDLNPSGFAYHFPIRNLTREGFIQLMTPLFYLGWFDRATRHIIVDMNFINPSTQTITNLELRIANSHAGAIETQALCGTVRLLNPLSSENWTENVPDLLLIIWVLIMTFDALRACISTRAVGFVIVRSGEVLFHWLIFALCAFGMYARVRYVLLQREIYNNFGEREQGSFDSQVAHLVYLSELANIVLSVAFFFCMVRFSFYYSLVSKRFYLLRKVMASYVDLIPALTLTIIMVLAFGFFAHSTFGSSSRQWATLYRSTTALLVMLRKPSRIDLTAMQPGDPLSSIGADGIVAPLFFIAFTFSVVIIITALSRATVIHAYSRAIEESDGTPTDLVKDSPWPSLNPFDHFRDFTDHVKLKITDWRATRQTRKYQRTSIQRQKQQHQAALMQAEAARGDRAELSRLRRMQEKMEAQRAKRRWGLGWPELRKIPQGEAQR